MGLYQVAKPGHLVASDPCCQHKTANCLAPMTKHLGIAAPAFCTSHVIRQGQTFRDVLKHVNERLSNPNNLTLVDETYDAVLEDREYAEALLDATYFKPEMTPEHMELSEAEAAHGRTTRRRNGEALMHILPGNWRQGAWILLTFPN